ncbi:MAG TPA: Nif3-like dinuclear metal center hexameric protein [Deltaproteobacteria bacterium]|nr:Nif3-like dinuclear metal center hexameric protein [Deltaproteobacteria bacterium]HPR53972.1 Nif3-like dinuclear metal center hexameric protein [Deltaproteobacteria bacterium]HXK46405.1 Nif3-like dinuclear metal center hexameric protein [Deltaproteobacteria bacterium]
MTLRDVMTVLDAIAPFDTAEEWDNAGLQVGDPSVEVTSVLVALDPSIEVISRAGRLKTDLIVTHHPLMIKPIPRLDLSSGTTRKIGMLIRGGISLVSMHTNLDKTPGGVADELASRLDLHGITPYGALRVGTLGRPTPLDHWCRELPFSGARICNAGRDVYRVAACPGSGMDYWRQASALGCDTLVTGDVRYHAGLDAVEAGMNVVDLGHFGTEEIIVKPLAARLRRELKRVVVRAHRGRDVFSSL